jgi:cytochrome c peroxidase
MAKSIAFAADPSRPASLLLSYIHAVCAFVAPRPPGASAAIIDRLSHSRALTVKAIVLPLALATAFGCADHDSPPVEAEAPLTQAVAPAGFPTGVVTDTAPPDNQLTEERARLGRRLFYEPSLSRTRDISCGSCHLQENGFADPNPVSLGVEALPGTRNASSLSNLAWSRHFFWDGRATSLEEQAGKPIENPIEMDLSLDDAVARLREQPSYVRDFEVAYDDGVTADNLRRALASFVRTLVSGHSPYDEHLAGDDTHFSEAAARGERLFFDKEIECFHCHTEGALTNDGFFNNGSYVDGGDDEGRKLVTERAGDLGKFKVPGLRNVAVTGPYMHDGSVPTLREVLERYAAGGLGHPSTDPQIIPLTLTSADFDDMLAFFDALTDSRFLSDPRFAPPAR